MHYKLPIFTNQAYKYTNDTLEEIIKVLSWRYCFRISVWNYLIFVIDLDVIVEQLHSE